MEEIENRLDNIVKEHKKNLYNKNQEYLNIGIYDINKYTDFYEDLEDTWYKDFIYCRIKRKQTEGYNPNLTDKLVVFLQNEENFCNYFKEFLKLKIKTDYYVNLENEIINHSREKITNNTDDVIRPFGSEIPLGIPLIDKNLRKKNADFVIQLGHNCDDMYSFIEEYLNLIENTNEEISFDLFLDMKTF